MKKIFLCFAVSAAMIFAFASCGRWQTVGGTTGTPSNLRTDLIENTDVNYGKGRYATIASSRPNFSWVVPPVGSGTVQVAYRIVLDKLTGAGLWSFA